MTQFFVKDQESISVDPNTYFKVLLYTHNNKGAHFFGVEPDKAMENIALVQEKLNMLLRHNVWVEAVVEKSIEGYLFLRDTAVRY